MKLEVIQPRVDPRQLGANCDECPLKEHTPVPPQVNNQASLVICGEAPGKEEVIQSKPFVGASGWWLDKRLLECGVSRAQVHTTNALLCRPPKKFSDLQWKQALECCRPRLERELAEVRPGDSVSLLACGGKAAWSLTDPTGPFNKPASRDKIFSWRGAPLQVGRFVVLPTIHPAFVLRAPHYKAVFLIDLRRAVNPPAQWQWPRILVEPGAEMRAALQEILAADQPVGVDIENLGDPLNHARIRCIGVATREVAVSVPLELNPVEEAILLGHILASNQVKVYHNAPHDILGMKVHNIHTNGRIFDTLLAHAVFDPLMPHDLGFVASYFFPAPRWKSEHKVESEDRGLALFANKPIAELCLYNAKDAWMQRMLKDELEKWLG